MPFLFDRICWAFSVYTLFILTCAHWILHVYYIMLFFLQKINSMEQYITKNHCPCHIQVLETRGQMLTAFKSWFVAWYGHFLWNCPNIYPRRFLLLLCQKVSFKLFPCWWSFMFWFSQNRSSCCLKQVLPEYIQRICSSVCSIISGQHVLRLPAGVVWLDFFWRIKSVCYHLSNYRKNVNIT